MGLRSIRVDAASAECLVFTRKEGLLSRVAHDLKLRVGDFEIAWDGDTLTARADARSLCVVSAMRRGREDPRALGAADKAEIEQHIRRDVLHVRRHPSIGFRSTQVVRQGDAFRIRGELDLHGVKRPIAVRLEQRGERWTAQLSLHQPDYGIEPFSAMLGTLKVKPDVQVQVSVAADAIADDLLPA